MELDFTNFSGVPTVKRFDGNVSALFPIRQVYVRYDANVANSSRRPLRLRAVQRETRAEA
jgi:hypothetical protein